MDLYKTSTLFLIFSVCSILFTPRQLRPFQRFLSCLMLRRPLIMLSGITSLPLSRGLFFAPTLSPELSYFIYLLTSPLHKAAFFFHPYSVIAIEPLSIFFAWQLGCVLSILELGECSGYKLNLHKSELFPLNSATINCPLSTSPFQNCF